MRRRRAERLVQQADAAVHSGSREEARAFLDEARSLSPSVPRLRDVEALLDTRSVAVVPAEARPSRWKECAAAAGVLAFAGAGVSVLVTHAPELLQSRDVRAVVETIAFTPPAAIEPAGPESIETLKSGDPGEPAESGAAVEPGAGEPEGSAEAVKRIEARPPPTVSVQPSDTPVTRVPSDPPVTGVPSDPIAVEPARLDLAPAAPVSIPSPPSLNSTVFASMPPSISPASRSRAVQPSPDALVRDTLGLFAKAYSDLDVDAAEQVWPTVNRPALARAFGSLQYQRVSLGDCRIQVEGNAARARCTGSATWSPKVGGGVRTDDRSWNFDLQKSARGWLIVSARVQNR